MSGTSQDHPLTLQNSPFWTLTPSLSQNIHVHDLKILAPMDRIGNTDGCNLDSCRNALVENLYIANSDDGVCMKAGLDGFGMNLGVPTENVLVRNITTAAGFRGGFAIGSEMSGGVRNVTYRDSRLLGQRGIHIKPSVGRGGYIVDLTFENISITETNVYMKVGSDGVPLEPGNHYVPLVSGLRFVDIEAKGGCSIDCKHVNGSHCYNTTSGGNVPDGCTGTSGTTVPMPVPVSTTTDTKITTSTSVPSQQPPIRPQHAYACKRIAHGMFGTITLPWPVCIPLDAPVNNDPNYPNWGPVTGHYASLEECMADGCV